MASISFAEEDLSCPVCCDIFINPVLLPCSHSVCSACIQRVWENKTCTECPLCRRTSSNDDPPLNLALRNLCESFLQERGQKSSSEGVMVCSDHNEKLKLFCLDDQQPVCVVCRDSRKHTDHRFCPVDEAAMDNKEILKASLEDLQEGLRISVNREQNLCKTAEDIKCQAQRTETQIQEVFNELHQLLHDEETFRIAALREEEEQKNRKITEEIEEMSKQISSLRSTIRDIEQQMKTEDVSFLQNFKATLQRAQFSLPDPDLSPSVTATFTDHLTNLKLNVLQKIQGSVGETPDFNIDHVILDDSVKYDEYKYFQSGGGINMFEGQLSKEPRQVKGNKMKTVSPFDWAKPVNDSPQVKGNKMKTVSPFDWAKLVNDSPQVKGNEMKTVSPFDWAKPVNDSPQVKGNKIKTVSPFDWAKPVNDSPQVKGN